MLAAVALVLTAGAKAAAAAPWAVLPGGDGRPARAAVSNDGGDELSVFADSAGGVQLEFVPAAPSPLRPDSCPTVQFDERGLLHHARVSGDCDIDGRRARFMLGIPAGRRLESAPLYQLMNGSTVVFRYATRNGAYHEARFPLTRSKTAILRVLGRSLDVQPGAAALPAP